MHRHFILEDVNPDVKLVKDCIIGANGSFGFSVLLQLRERQTKEGIRIGRVFSDHWTENVWTELIGLVSIGGSEFSMGCCGVMLREPDCVEGLYLGTDDGQTGEICLQGTTGYVQRNGKMIKLFEIGNVAHPHFYSKTKTMDVHIYGMGENKTFPGKLKDGVLSFGKWKFEKQTKEQSVWDLSLLGFKLLIKFLMRMAELIAAGKPEVVRKVQELRILFARRMNGRKCLFYTPKKSSLTNYGPSKADMEKFVGLLALVGDNLGELTTVVYNILVDTANQQLINNEMWAEAWPIIQRERQKRKNETNQSSEVRSRSPSSSFSFSLSN